MRRPLSVAALVLAVGFAQEASAKPIAPSIFCAQYADAPICMGGQPACTFCHTAPPARNAFGEAIEAKLASGVARPLTDADFMQHLPDALSAIETEDADGDEFSNVDEIIAGTYPGDRESIPVDDGCPPDPAKNGGFDVCNYDARYVFKKLHLDFCGTTVPFDRLQAFDIIEDKDTEIHNALERCLDTEHWLGKDGVLYKLAHKKIRPVQSIKSGAGAGSIPLGDYDDDYALFVYTQIDNRDARELLTAQYFVQANPGNPTTYETFTRSPIQDLQTRGQDVAQLVNVDKRAGLLTTRWNFVLNTMFTAVPRTTAAQAYRAFLGLDIARMEGLSEVPIPGEPADYDQKGVQAEACRGCHETLDPLTYPFTRYSGFNGGIPFSYVPNRMQNMASGPNDPLNNVPERGIIFGQEVFDLLEWAQVAANSDQFAKAVTLDYWMLLLGEPPRPTEQAEFERIWRSFKEDHQYGVERMLHDLVATEAYGVP